MIKQIHRKYIKYSTLPNIILYTGPFANGKTLSAIKQLVDEKDKRPIISTNHLFHILSTFISSTETIKLLEYKDTRFLFDSAYALTDSRRNLSTQNRMIIKWFELAPKLNNKIILTMAGPEYLDRCIRDLIRAVFVPFFYFTENKNPRCIIRRYYYNRRGKLNKVIIYPSFDASKYFKYYNTTEITGLIEKEKDKQL